VSLMAFALQVLPVSLMALAATLIGGLVHVSGAWQLPLLLVGVLLFVALLTFRRAPGWNLALLLALATVAGMLLGSAFRGEQGASWGGALALAFALMGLAALIGYALRGRLGRAGCALWILAWVYLLGWLAFMFLNPANWLRAAWSGAGLVIFGLLLVVWFSDLTGEEKSSRGLAVSQGTDLYLLGFNIAVAARVLILYLATS
jgi:FtsH-binding integral membrane protein